MSEPKPSTMTDDERLKLIAWLESRAQVSSMPGSSRMYKLALDAIRAQPTNEPLTCDALEAETDRAEKAEAKNRWIPVSERLPKESEYRNGDRYKSMDSNELIPFLVCCKDTEIPFRAFYDGKNWGDGWSRIAVTHWMTLSKMSKEENDA